jgi:hypothetical protein
MRDLSSDGVSGHDIDGVGSLGFSAEVNTFS